ncbi:glycosyl hydrolase family 5 [Mesobaculum littorinae]|uniref:cellulase n=1 Tax=Mesobaculum littorinae TaxID=2486419 RepID=A0A438AD45_9RHOB|nr:glycosyl hydrolase family 8 [Mesobaculum littorinae]RVV96597.1 glycosyl hydrolase family 5 [Mesobaculum littorinae]
MTTRRRTLGLLATAAIATTGLIPALRQGRATPLDHGATPGARADDVEAAASPLPGWDAWKAAFLREDGRVVDGQQGAVSHSEGQGYGLLLAQAAGDRAAFDGIERWTRAHLARREDSLMGWRWHPDTGRLDLQTATDGDLFRAWALWRADRQSGWGNHEAEVAAIARDLAALCLIPDPRAASEPLLSPFARPEGDGDAILVNPSYYMSRALRELGTATGREALIRAADHGETLLADIAARDWLPDWLTVTDAGPVEATGYFPGLGYDALRIPLYLTWSGRGDHPAVALAQRLRSAVQTGLPAGHVPTVIGPAGTLQDSSDYAGYRRLWAVVSAASRATASGDGAPPVPLADAANPGQPILDTPSNLPAPYYPATLDLLARVAWREGGLSH